MVIDYEKRTRPSPILDMILSVTVCLVTAFLTIRPFLPIDPFYAGIVDILWFFSFIFLVGAIVWVIISVIQLIIFFRNKDSWRIDVNSDYMLEYYDKVYMIHLTVNNIEKVSKNEYKLNTDEGEFFTKVDTPREFNKLNKAQDLLVKNGKTDIYLGGPIKIKEPLIKEIDSKRYIHHLFGLKRVEVIENYKNMYNK